MAFYPETSINALLVVYQFLASRFGKFLGMDNTTLYRTRATRVRICVDVDLLEEPITGSPR